MTIGSGVQRPASSRLIRQSGVRSDLRRALNTACRSLSTSERESTERLASAPSPRRLDLRVNDVEDAMQHARSMRIS